MCMHAASCIFWLQADAQKDEAEARRTVKRLTQMEEQLASGVRPAKVAPAVEGGRVRRRVTAQLACSGGATIDDGVEDDVHCDKENAGMCLFVKCFC